ncbi:MAG: aminopeptidase [Bacteroides sp. SM23_62_1]|nr:MAG: aminopeptidase [Bacteroides sp. SM23_62_1]
MFYHNSVSQDLPDRARARDIGILVGMMKTGNLNAITDVPGVMVGHQTLVSGDSIRTGVTAILPHPGNIFMEKVPAAIYVFNGFGKLAGYTQVRELGNIETPIILTNTLSVPIAVNALIRYTLSQKGNENIRSVNGIVGETNDGYLNDIRGLHVTEDDVFTAIKAAEAGMVQEGSVGAGTGTTALGFKGGIGTASRLLPVIDGRQYTVGVLVQSNFGRDLIINGLPFSRENLQSSLNNEDEAGSCMIVIATDAPLSERNLERLGKRAFIGMGKTTTVMSNGSGDYAIAFSTGYQIPYYTERQTIENPPLVSNDGMTIFFKAVEEATQEAIYNSLFMATTITGYRGHTAEAISLEKVKQLVK